MRTGLRVLVLDQDGAAATPRGDEHAVKGRRLRFLRLHRAALVPEGISGQGGHDEWEPFSTRAMIQAARVAAAGSDS